MPLVNYTASKVGRRPANITPLIRVHSNGMFVIYKSLLKALGYKSASDKVMFSHDDTLNTWYISLDDRGMPLRQNTNNYSYTMNTTTLRNKILKSQRGVLKTDFSDNEAFYLSAELTASRIINEKEFFKIELIAS